MPHRNPRNALLDVAPFESIAIDRAALENPAVMVLTEASLPALAVQIYRGQVPWIAATRSLCGVFAPLLKGVASALASRGKIRLLATADERIAGFRDWGDLYRFTDTFSTHEAWMDRTVEIDTFEERFGEYAIAAKQISCNLAFQRYLELYRVHGLLRYARSHHLTGFDAFDIAFLREALGNDIAAKPVSRPTATFFKAAAGLCRIGQLVVEAVRVAIRPSAPGATVLMNCDHINDEKDYNLWRDVPDNPDDIRVVFRNQSFTDPAGLPDFIRHWATMGNGALPMTQAFSAFVSLVRDILRLARNAMSLPSEFCFQIIGLPNLRLRSRSFLHRYPCVNFMGRDDYNPDHIMRSLELRRIGATSLGIMHGLPAFMRAVHQIRYIDFDTYYVFGQDIWTNCYRDKWPDQMKVRATGGFGLSREEFGCLKGGTGRNIMIIANPCFQQERLFEAWVDIARAFPDRQIYISAKKGFMERSTFGVPLKAALERGPSNISVYTGRTYELFGRCGYAVNEASTLAAETAQCGMASFVLDVDPRLRYLFYRRYPEMCVSSAGELIEKIQLIEANRWRYPIEEFDGLVPINGTIIWDMIRRDLGICVDAMEIDNEAITELELQK